MNAVHLSPAFAHSASVAHSWTAPSAVIGHGAAWHTVAVGFMMLPLLQQIPVAQSALLMQVVAAASPPLLLELLELPDEDPPESLPPPPSSPLELLDEELQPEPAARAKPRPREATKKIFELCMGNPSSSVDDKRGTG